MRSCQLATWAKANARRRSLQRALALTLLVGLAAVASTLAVATFVPPAASGRRIALQKAIAVTIVAAGAGLLPSASRAVPIEGLAGFYDDEVHPGCERMIVESDSTHATVEGFNGDPSCERGKNKGNGGKVKRFTIPVELKKKGSDDLKFDFSRGVMKGPKELKAKYEDGIIFFEDGTKWTKRTEMPLMFDTAGSFGGMNMLNPFDGPKR